MKTCGEGDEDTERGRQEGESLLLVCLLHMRLLLKLLTVTMLIGQFEEL